MSDFVVVGMRTQVVIDRTEVGVERTEAGVVRNEAGATRNEVERTEVGVDLLGLNIACGCVQAGSEVFLTSTCMNSILVANFKGWGHFAWLEEERAKN